MQPFDMLRASGMWLLPTSRLDFHVIVVKSAAECCAADLSSLPELDLELLAMRSTPTASGGEGAAAFRLDAEMKLKIGDYEDRLIESEDYLAGVDVLGTEANRRAALRRLATAAAKEALERYEVAERLSQ